MEELKKKVSTLHETLPDLDLIDDELQSVCVEFDKHATCGKDVEKQCQAKLQEFVSSQEGPLSSSLEISSLKSADISALRSSMSQDRKRLQTEFQKLLRAEEAVAFVTRQHDFMARLRAKFEARVSMLRDSSQGLTTGMQAGAVLLQKEQQLVKDMQHAMEGQLDVVRESSIYSLGKMHEISFQMIQMHFAVLEGQYNDLNHVIQCQRASLLDSERQLESGDLTKGWFFDSKEKQLSRQKGIIQKNKEQIVQTHEALMAVKERFRSLLAYSNSLRVAESLAKWNKTKYGHLISTNTIPDASTAYYWPELDELFVNPVGSGSPQASPARCTLPPIPEIEDQ